MGKTHIFRRYLIFFLGLLFNAFGVAFVTKASLGTSPIASIPYSLSLILPVFTMGNWTTIFSLALIVAQIFILGKDANKIELILQVLVAFAFGYFIDLSMALIAGFMPIMYLMKIASLLIGCTIITFGAYLEVIADVVMLSADAFIRALAKVMKKEYGGVRVASDVTMSLIAAALCLIFTHKLSGVREGTIVAALITGNIVKIFVKKLKGLTKVLIID